MKNMGDFDCEYKDYRAIGTVEECREAVEKQIPTTGCNKASLLRCRNCKHVECDKYKIMQILIRIGALN